MTRDRLGPAEDPDQDPDQDPDEFDEVDDFDEVEELDESVGDRDELDDLDLDDMADPARDAEDADTEPDDLEPIESGEGDGRTPVAVPAWPLPVMSAVLAFSLLVLGLLGYRWWQADRVESARAEAMAAAKVAAVDVFSYRYDRLDADFARAERRLTGEFARDYARTSEATVRPTAERTKAQVTTEVPSVGVVSADPGRVVVLAYLNRIVVSEDRDRDAERLPDQNRVRMTMDLVDGQWLVSSVDAF